MKLNRNEPCSCGSNKKYKNCCGKDNNADSSLFSQKTFSAIIAAILLGAVAWAVIEFYQEDRPEMEAYKCDNPNCNQWHYRPKTN